MRLCRVEPVILRDTTEVDSVAFSPDGEQLASAGGDGTVKIWNSRTGKLIQTLNAHTRLRLQRRVPPRRQAPGLDGRGPAGEGLGLDDRPGSVRRPVRRRPLRNGTAYTVAFSPDGRQLAAGSDGGSEDLGLERTISSCRPSPDNMKTTAISVAFSPDGRRWRSGSWGEALKIWDAETGASSLRTIPGAILAIPSARWRSARTAGGWPRPASTGRVKVWDTTTGELFHTLRGTPDSLSASPSAATAGASPRRAKTRRSTSGTRRPTGRCSTSADTPTCASAWRSAPTAGASPRPARTGPSASGMRPRCRETRARKS